MRRSARKIVALIADASDLEGIAPLDTLSSNTYKARGSSPVQALKCVEPSSGGQVVARTTIAIMGGVLSSAFVTIAHCCTLLHYQWFDCLPRTSVLVQCPVKYLRSH